MILSLYSKPHENPKTFFRFYPQLVFYKEFIIVSKFDLLVQNRTVYCNYVSLEP